MRSRIFSQFQSLNSGLRPPPFVTGCHFRILVFACLCFMTQRNPCSVRDRNVVFSLRASRCARSNNSSAISIVVFINMATHTCSHSSPYQADNPLAALIQPIHRPEQAAKLGVVCGKSRQPFADLLAIPPSFLAKRREPVAIKSRPNIMRRRVGKWIVREERERTAIVMQKFPNKMDRPRILGRSSHGREPDLPVDPPL